MPSWSQPSTRSRRTLAPVAISACPNSTSSFVESRATRASVSSFITEARVSSSTSFSCHQLAGRNAAASRSDAPARYAFDSGGRSYGASCSRPTTSTDRPAAPSPSAARSSRAHEAAATPPPISRKSTRRSATPGGAGRLTLRCEARGDLLLEARVEHEQYLVAHLDHRVGERDEAGAVAQDRVHDGALRHADVLHHLARGRRTGQHLDLDDLEPLLRQVEEVQKPDARHLVLDQAQDQVGGRHRR